MKILGIDPGIHGGLAIRKITDRAAPQLIDAIDVPVIGAGAKERVDVLAAGAVHVAPRMAALGLATTALAMRFTSVGKPFLRLLPNQVESPNEISLGAAYEPRSKFSKPIGAFAVWRQCRSACSALPGIC
jgi:hypothetical protein